MRLSQAARHDSTKIFNQLLIHHASLHYDDLRSMTDFFL